MALTMMYLGSNAFVGPALSNIAAPRCEVVAKVNGLVGDCAPLGYFDPLGFSTGKTLEQMTSYREAELKHGRAAMAACLHWVLVPYGFHPLAKSCHVSHPENPLKSLYEVRPAGWLQIFIFVGFLEFLGLQIKKNPTYKAGDLLGASELVDDTDAGWVDYQQKELNNGRLAMIGTAGMIAQELATGQKVW